MRADNQVTSANFAMTFVFHYYYGYDLTSTYPTDYGIVNSVQTFYCMCFRLYTRCSVSAAAKLVHQ